jgi:hypothetical protein
MLLFKPPEGVGKEHRGPLPFIQIQAAAIVWAKLLPVGLSIAVSQVAAPGSMLQFAQIIFNDSQTVPDFLNSQPEPPHFTPRRVVILLDGKINSTVNRR